MDTKAIARDLIKSAEKGNYEGVNTRIDQLLSAKKDLNSVDAWGRTAMMLAAENAHGSIVQLLINNGANINVTDGWRWTAIMYGTRSGKVSIVQMLIDQGADVNLVDRDGWTVIMKAAYNGYSDIVQLLADNGADIHMMNSNYMTPIMMAIERGHVDVVQVLIDNGADRLDTALIHVAENGHGDVWQLLVDKGADIHATDAWGTTAMMKAAENAHGNIVQLLIDNGANIHEADSVRESLNNRWFYCLLFIFAYSPNTSFLCITGTLMQRGRTAIMYAVEFRNENYRGDVLQLLIDYGANIHATDSRGMTATMWAARNSRWGERMVQLLWKNGADLNVLDKEGRNAYDHAKFFYNDDVCKIIYKKKKFFSSKYVVRDVPQQPSLPRKTRQLQKQRDDENRVKVEDLATEQQEKNIPTEENRVTDVAVEVKRMKLLAEQPDSTVALKTDYEATLVTMSRDLLRVKEVQEQLSSRQHDASTVQHLQAQVDAIDNKYKSSPLDRAERDHIAASPELKLYYELVQKVFNEAFLVSMAISTDMIEVQQQSASQVFSVLSTLSQGIPFVPGVLSFIEGRVDSLLGARQDGRYGFLSNLNPTSNAFDAALYAERVARHVTIALEDSIKTIEGKKNPSEIKAIKKFMKLLEAQVNKVDKGLAAGLFGEESALELLAYKHAKDGLEYVMSGHLKETEPEEGLQELVAHMTGCDLTRLSLATPTAQPDTSLSTSAIRVTVTAAHDQQSQQPRHVSESVHWIEMALKHKAGVTEQHIMLYESILTRNEIYSKEELASLTDEEFRDDVVKEHVGELKPVGVKKRFEALHALCRSGATTITTIPCKVGSHDQVSEQLLVMKQLIAKMQKQLEANCQMNPSDVASARLVRRLQRELADTKRTLHAIFQTTLVDDGSRVQEAVATREGATVRVVNREADEQFQALRGTLVQLQEDMEAMQRDKEAESARRKRCQK